MSTKRKTITLSEHLGTTTDKLNELGILNTNLGVDTKLFIDPKLVRQTQLSELQGASQVINSYFNDLLKINNQSDKTERLRNIAISMIAIKEPIGLAIGYGDSRDSGTAISKSVANASLKSLNEILSVGFEDLRVMEMLGLFIKGFGADSISDLIAHICYTQLCEFTERVCNENGFETFEFTINDKQYMLPQHPFRGTQIIFAPLTILDELPLATDWDEVASAAIKNSKVRDEFNDLVGGNVEDFAKRVRKNPSMLTAYTERMETLVEVYDNAEVEPYNPRTDPKGYIRLAEYLDEISGTLSTESRQLQNGDQVKAFVLEKIISQFRRQIERLGGNKLLYKRMEPNLQQVDANSPVHEEAFQLLFHGIADQMCQESNVMVSRESKTSPGAVDFSLGVSYDTKILVEVKKSSNNSLIDGYEKQLQAYEEAEAAFESIYLIVVVKNSDTERESSQLNELRRMYFDKLKKHGNAPELVIIDGLIHDSASKLH